MLAEYTSTSLGTVAQTRKASVTFVTSVCPSDGMYESDSQWREFQQVLFWGLL